MDEVDREGVTARQRKRWNPAGPEPFRVAVLTPARAEKYAEQEQKAPRQKRVVVGAEKSRRRKTEPEQPFGLVQRRGEPKQAQGPKPEIPLAERTGDQKQNAGDNRAGERRDLGQNRFGSGIKQHAEAEIVKNAEDDQLIRHDEEGDCGQQHPEGESPRAAFGVAPREMAGDAGEHHQGTSHPVPDRVDSGAEEPGHREAKNGGEVVTEMIEADKDDQKSPEFIEKRETAGNGLVHGVPFLS